MAKEIDGYIKLQVRGGAANPAPPVGPALGAKGVNIMDFCNKFNDMTKDKAGKLLPVVVTVYKDKSIELKIKTPPAAAQLIEIVKIKKGSSEPNRQKVGNVTWGQIEQIAKDKMPDLNTNKLDSAMKMIAGTARNMGLNIKGTSPWGEKEVVQDSDENSINDNDAEENVENSPEASVENTEANKNKDQITEDNDKDN